MIIRANKGDYGTTITFPIKDEDGNAENLASVTSATVTIGRIREAVPLVDADACGTASGEVTWTPSSGDLDTAGYYDAVITMNYSSGIKSTKKFTIHVLENIKVT